MNGCGAASALNRGRCAYENNNDLKKYASNIAAGRQFYNTGFSIDADIKPREARDAQALYQRSTKNETKIKILENNIQIMSDLNDALTNITDFVSNIANESGQFSASELFNEQHSEILYKTISSKFNTILSYINKRSVVDNSAIFSGDYVEREAIPKAATELLDIYRINNVIRPRDFYNGGVKTRVLAGSEIELPTALVFEKLLNCMASFLNKLADNSKISIPITQESLHGFVRELSDIHSEISKLSGEVLFHLGNITEELKILRSSVAQDKDNISNHGMVDNADSINKFSDSMLKSQTYTAVSTAIKENNKQLINNAMR
ncbi:hypothetical protein Cyrtocomes_00457 [Candidatus Cyrtobacter comes]|uniref:Flagellin n=2 Tax=Candidatus Cyrtobacter comes TaxID=675776 RepID=A0ABU5L7I8_9RICK|nr:hypothetical protein [Candidatus Cyrtobacter comes]